MRLALILILFTSYVVAKECSYTTYTWNVNTRSVTQFKTISKDYLNLSNYEVDETTGCTVCSQDQIEINIPNIKPFKACKHLAAGIKRALLISIQDGQQVQSVIGYRVGMTRGNIDKNGNRTRFSNHSFGIAIDINSKHNGLYKNCIKFNKECILIKGDKWEIQHPQSLKPNSPLVKRFKYEGLLWGGEIYGWQKDFMHFSPTGY